MSSRSPLLALFVAAALHPSHAMAAGMQSRPETPAAAAEGGEAVVIGRTHTLRSAVLRGDRRIVVRLPAGYAEQPDRRYDVVYLIDGGPEQDFPHIAGLAQSTEVNGVFTPFILVGVETVKRRQEITPPVRNAGPYIAELGVAPGGSAAFRRFLAEEVKPWIERRYRTSGRDAVMGESLAGLFVVETLFEAPGLFDDYIAVSPSLWWEDMKFGREAEGYLARLPAASRRLYLALADEGLLHQEGVERLVTALRRAAPRDLEWTYVPQGDQETHASIYHPAALDAFRTLYGRPAQFGIPGALLSGRPLRDRTPAELARRARPCTRETARPATPAETRTGHDEVTYECLLYELGPRPAAAR